MGAVEPAAQRLPTGQSVQSLAFMPPVLPLKVPTAQSRGVTVVAEGQYLPAGQTKHWLWPVAD